MEQPLYSDKSLRVVALDGGVLEIVLDRQSEPVNTVDRSLLTALDVVMSTVVTQETKGVLISSAKSGFLAGANLDVLQDMQTATHEDRLEFLHFMDRVLTRLEDLQIPSVSAINGHALGGGLEVALSTDCRVAATDAKLGFPEIGFGILPGGTGSVRTPRLTDGATALDWLLTGRQYKAAEAKTAGMVDLVVEPDQLRAEALAWLKQAIQGGVDWQGRRVKRKGPFAMDAEVFAAARTQAKKNAQHCPAPLAIVELLERCAPLDRDQALKLEADTGAYLMGTQTAQALVAVFVSNLALKKIIKGQSGGGRPVKRAAVLGAGIMGGGVAYTSALKGTPVLLKDIAQPALDLGMREAQKLLSRQVVGHRLSQAQADAIHASIVPTLTLDEFGTVDIVVEAVVENIQVKQDVLKLVEASVKPGTVLASNTSSLSIGGIAGPLQRREDVVGMHFFNPVHMMPLVEVIKSPYSSEAAVATTVAYASAMGKTPLVVKDCPGFLVNRLLGAYFAAFLMLIRDGADFQHIDKVMEGWGWPMGPAYLLDVAGIDTLDKAMVILGEAYPDVMGATFTTAFRLLAEMKRYGQKTGAGFYRYEADAKGKPIRSYDPAIQGILAPIQTGTRVFADQDILDRMMLAMLLEADRCLEEQVVGSAIEVDAGMRLGTGFPAHHCGPLWYADRLGLSEVLSRCEAYRPLGGLYHAGAGLQRRAAGRQAYYAGC